MRISVERLDSPAPARPSAPTAELPGSEEKLEILCRRAASRAELFVSGDEVDNDKLALELHNFHKSGKAPLGARKVVAAVDEEEARGRSGKKTAEEVIEESFEGPAKACRQRVRRVSHPLPRVSLAGRLKELCERKDISYKALARKTGMSVRQVHRIVNDGQMPTTLLLWAIADALEVSMDEVVGRKVPAPA